MIRNVFILIVLMYWAQCCQTSDRTATNADLHHKESE